MLDHATTILTRGEAHYSRARAYAFKGEPQNAIGDLLKAIELDAGYKNKVHQEAAFVSLRHRPEFAALFEK